MSIPAKPHRRLREGEVCYDTRAGRAVVTLRTKTGSSNWHVEAGDGARWVRRPALLIPLPDEHPLVYEFLLSRIER